MTQTLPNLHLLEEVAERYRLSLISLRRRARARGFTHIKIGKKRYLTDEQVMRLLEGATVASEQDEALAKTAKRITRRHARAHRPAA